MFGSRIVADFREVKRRFDPDNLLNPGKIVSTSQEVEVQILEVDPVKRRISLGLKQTMRNPWEVFVEKYPPGSIVEGEVKNKTEFGLFLGKLKQMRIWPQIILYTADEAERLGVTGRHLRRLFLQHLGATPFGVGLTRRTHFAKKLLDETTPAMRDVALASRFGSLRRFNSPVRRTH
ncbi:helix-turn-helix domain-containing protein, partial [Lacticaseibacillus rhamnosus]